MNPSDSNIMPVFCIICISDSCFHNVFLPNGICIYYWIILSRSWFMNGFCFAQWAKSSFQSHYRTEIVHQLHSNWQLYVLECWDERLISLWVLVPMYIHPKYHHKMFKWGLVCSTETSVPEWANGQSEWGRNTMLKCNSPYTYLSVRQSPLKICIGCSCNNSAVWFPVVTRHKLVSVCDSESESLSLWTDTTSCKVSGRNCCAICSKGSMHAFMYWHLTLVQKWMVILFFELNGGSIF